MVLIDVALLLVGAVVEIALASAIVIGPLLLDCLKALSSETWPGER